ncbi:MAG: NarK/NasA family nitrate transporter [Fimbriimonadales bacterium]|nr:NarK/NasA family nitrate transporter [Fimbriimonadales bacterium]
MAENSNISKEIGGWAPEDPEFWQTTGSKIAWRTLIVTTFCLILSFSTWFMVSAIVVKLSGIGFKFTESQLFWLNSMPGLAAGSLRIVHTFLIPIFGTRTTVTISTLLLLIPCIGWGMAVQNPDTSYATFMLLGFLAGLGGGNFSSFMPSTSLFFPKRMQGLALGIQAGIGNFGVSVAQFVIPWVIGFSMIASLGAAQTFTKDGKSSDIWLQNAAYVWAPFVVLAAILAWISLRSVPVKASFREQLDIFKDKHTWLMTSLYIMTFGSFSGFSAAFPLLIKNVYGKFDGAPEPLAFAFLGPLIGASIRVAFGPISDKFGGAKVTMISGIGLLVCAIGVTFFTRPDSLDQWPGFLIFMLGLFLFSGIGNASTFKQMPMIFPPRQAGGVIGWTAAIAAYGPFLFSVLFGAVIASTGSPTAFFYGATVFYAINLWINWWFYMRKGAEKPC